MKTKNCIKKKIPGIIYNSRLSEINIIMENKDVIRILKIDKIINNVLNLIFKNQINGIIFQNIHIHPYKKRFLHLELLNVKFQKKISVNIPIIFNNKDKNCAKKINNIKIFNIVDKVNVVGFPNEIPKYIEVSLSKIHKKSSIHLNEISVPNNINIKIKDQTIAYLFRVKKS